MIWHVLAWIIEGIGMAAVASIGLIWLDHRVQRHRETRATIRRAAQIGAHRERGIRANAERLVDETEAFLRAWAEEETP